ncbi:nucleoside hydrolase [Corynebacterium tapiri]|uniref:Nucleoside hydrolase n=1 Tax=Corynebacterium tapiri TaxID=1448266 RepID=A0A5C4U3V5_9CORY|nr:nucleoside hydrolase [Corynebacterium tapiri]TNL96799.1 nucleoside hydrolase [Corynebacterium tapiri]
MHPVIIDTDTAQDDCVTILLGLLDPACDLRAVTMVAGNVTFERQVHNAAMTLSVAGKLGEVPLHLGCDRPMMRPWVSAEDVHGDGSGGLSMEFDESVVDPKHGVDALIDAVNAEPGEISIVAIGPLTNIATAVVKDRSFASKVKSLYVMGGSNNGRGNVTPSAEFNFYVDPEAAQIVMDAGFKDLKIVTWDPVTLVDATYSREDYNNLCRFKTPIGKFFRRVCDATLDFNESVGVMGSTHPDSITLGALLHPELVLQEGSYRVDVECQSTLTRGFSAMAWDKYDLEPNATVFEKLDGQAFYRILEGILATETQPSREIEGL